MRASFLVIFAVFGDVGIGELYYNFDTKLTSRIGKYLIALYYLDSMGHRRIITCRRQSSLSCQSLDLMVFTCNLILTHLGANF